MGSSSTSTTEQKSTQSADPRMQAAVAPLLSQVGNVASTPYNSGMNQRVAGMNAQQLAAIQGLGQLQNNNPAASYIASAADYARAAADPNNVNAMTNAYYNPMASKVMDQFSNVMGQQAAQLKGNEAASGAIGGSRASVANSTLANQQGLAAGQIASQLYNQAQQSALTTAGQQAGAAYSLGNLGQESLSTGLTGINAALMGGNQLQQQAQNVNTANTANAIQRTLFPQQELGAAANIAGIGTTLGGTSYGTGTQTQPVNYLGQVLGAGLAGYGLYASDEKVKENIEPIGSTYDKQTLYRFNYIGDPSPRIGLMAQEVAKKHPDAVKDINGTKAVDYNKATAKSVQMGEQRVHRDIGGGVGVGNSPAGLQGYSGIQSPLQSYFTSPQVNVPQTHFPQLNLSTGDNKAQQQADQNAKGLMDLGKDLSKGHLGSDINSGLGNLAFGSSPTTSDGGWSTSTQPSGGFIGGLGDYFGAADGGRIHRDMGGRVDDQSVVPMGTPASTLERFLNRRQLDASLQPLSSSAPTMGAQSSIPAPGTYFDLDDQGRRIGAAPQPSEKLNAVYNPSGPQQPMLQPAALTSSPPPVATSIPKAPDLAPNSTAPGKTSRDDLTEAMAAPANTIVPKQPAAQPVAIGSPAQVPAPIASPQQGQQFHPQQVVQTSIDELRAGGMNDNAIRGVLVNYKDESGFNPGLRHPDQPHFIGEAHYAHGLAQEGGGEWNRYAAWLNQNAPHSDWRDPALQNKFLAWNLRTNYPQVWEQMQNGTPEQAAQAFLTGYLKPAAKYQTARSAQYANGVPDLDTFLKSPVNASASGPSDLQPPKRDETNLGQLMKTMFGMDMSQPQGLGGSLGRALGTNPSMDPQTANRLVGLGVGMMAAGPSVGIPGVGGAISGALSAFGKGGQFALNQEQQERAQAINLANAAMNQQLHNAQIRHYNMESQKPFVAKTTAETVVDPTTGMVIGTKNINHYAQFDENGKMHWVDDATNNALNGQGGASSTGRPTIPDLDTIQGTGDALVKDLKKSGYSPALVDEAYQVAQYKSDPRQIASRSRHEQLFIDRLAHRLNPDYDPARYPAAAGAEKTLTNGKVSQGLASIGRLFDEVEIASDRAKKLKNWGSENANAIAGFVSPSSSEYTTARTDMSTAINNVADAAAAAAKGGSQGAEGDARRRVKLMNPDMHEKPLLKGLATEAETALKMGQSNLNPYNTAHGYTPDNPKYKTIMDYMTPSQQKKAVKLLGPEMIEEITGKPVNMGQTSAIPARPSNIPEGSQYNPQLNQWRDPQKRLYDSNGAPING